MTVTVDELRKQVDAALEQARRGAGVSVGEHDMDPQLVVALQSVAEDPFDDNAIIAVWKAFARQISGESKVERQFLLKDALKRTIK